MTTTLLEKILFGVLMLFFMVTPTLHILHMFQQNRYERNRMLAWMKDTFFKGFLKVLPLNLLLVAFIVAEWLWPIRLTGVILVWLIGFLAMGLAVYHFQKKSIKPLVFTARVIRQIVVIALLDILFLFCFLSFQKSLALGLTTLVCFYLNWIVVFLMDILTTPIENGVKKKYQKEAQTILENRSDLVIIGITGSYGKTSTKNIIQEVVSQKYLSLMTPASYNTPMGITRTVRQYLKPIHQVFVCEMGADKVGDIQELMDFVHPTIGVVTSIGPQHLGTFGSQEAITTEKMKEIECLPENGVGILNVDNSFIRDYSIQSKCRILTYGIENEEAILRATDITTSPQGSSFLVQMEGKQHRVETKLFGKLNILNILAAIAVARVLDIPWKEIITAVKQVPPIEHRLEPKIINGRHFIDDAFNANPEGSSMALEVLGAMPGKRVIVTPGMIDLGQKQEEYNKAFGQKMKGQVDEVILVGQKQTKPILEGLESSGFDMSHCQVVPDIHTAFQIVYGLTSATDTILLENDLPDAFNH